MLGATSALALVLAIHSRSELGSNRVSTPIGRRSLSNRTLSATEVQLCLVDVMCAAPQLDVLDRRFTSGRKWLPMVILEKCPALAAAFGA